MKKMISQSDITEIYKLWSQLPFTKLLLVNQLNKRCQIEFVIDIVKDAATNSFFKEIQDLTIKKHPAGSVSFIGHWSTKGLNSQYKHYRIDFIDTLIRETIDKEKLNLYIETLKQCLKKYVTVLEPM